MERQKRNIKHSPLIRFASIVASAILVLNLLPVQGIAEARDELASLVNQQTQQQPSGASASDTATNGQTQTTPPTTAEPSSDASAPAQSNATEGGSSNAEPAPDDSESDLGGEESNANANGAAANSGTAESGTAESETAESGTAESGAVAAVAPVVVADPIPSNANLAEFLTEATIEGASVAGGVTNVAEDTAYNVKLSFAERADLQFADGEEMTFALPMEFSAVSEQKALDDPVVVRYVDEKGNKQEFALGKNAWSIDSDNVLHFSWRQADDGAQDGQAKNNEANFRRLTSLANVTFELRVRGTFASGVESVDFGRGPISLNVAVKSAAMSAEQGQATAGQQGSATQVESPQQGGTTEQQKPAADAQATKKPAADAQATKTVYTYEDDQVRVTATLAKASAIPDNAELRVTPVAPGAEDYDAYLAALNAKSANTAEHDANNTLLYDVAFVVDGREVQPAEGTVKVNFQFKQAQLANDLDAQKRSKVDVTHLPKVDGEPVAEKVDAKVSVEKETAEFEAKGFSVYAFSYTVDFTFGGYTYRMPGQGSIMLSSLLMALGINRSVADVAKVEFSNPALVSVVQVGINWRLTSLQSFTTPEVLTVTMHNGDKYRIDVTDPPVAGTLQTQGTAIGVQGVVTDLGQMVKSVSISAPTDASGKYTLMPGESYTITMSFAEDGAKEFPNDATHMTYSIPTDFTVPTTEEKTFKIIVTDPLGNQHVVEGNKYKINSNNLLEVWFNTDDSNFHYLADSTNARFSMSFDGEFDSTKKEIDFGNNVNIEVEPDRTNSVSAGKQAQIDLANKKVYYTVAVTSTGHSTGVQINDTITDGGTGVLTLDRTSFKRQSNKGDTSQKTIAESELTDSGNSFGYTIGDMKNGEVVTVTYSADINTSEIPTTNGKVQIVTGDNTVSVKSDGQPTPTSTNVKTRIDYTPKLYKGGMTLNEDGKSFKASYTFNGDALVDGSGYTLTDTLGQYLTLDGTTGASVTVYNQNGSVAREKANFNWGEGGFAKVSDTQFTYTVPSTDSGHNYKYVVEYEVKVDGTGQLLNSPETVTNTVEYDEDHKSTGQGVITPTDENRFEISKRADNIDYANNRITWTTTINVPAAGLTEAQAIVTDTLPGNWAPNRGWVQDELYVISNDTNYQQSVKVTGLKPGESYSVTPTQGTAGTNDYFTINFKKTGGADGLDASDAGRIVTVTYETTIDPDWLDAAKDNSWLQNHTNNVKIESKTASATADVAGAGVTKTSEIAGYRTLPNGTQLPVYKYTLLLKNVTADDNTIEDTFPRDLLMPLYTEGYDASKYGTLSFSPDYFAWHTTNQNNGTRSTNPVSYMETANGMNISTNYDSMVRDASTPTGYYAITKIMYYLTVKDEAALKKIQGYAVNNQNGGADDKTYSMHNEAKWGTSVEGADVTYKFPGITKEMLTPESALTVEDGEIYADFKLTVNPGGAMINGGNPYKITDNIDHLSIDITSIRVSPQPGEGEVVYDMSDNSLTFENVPDGKEFVITYRARVIYESTGSTGETVDVNFKNDVTMLTYEDHINKWAHRKNTGTGAADLYAIKLMKYQAGNMSQKLNGAEFTLYESKAGDDSAINPDNPTGYIIDTSSPVTDKKGNVVTFTSGGTRKYGLEEGASTQEEPGMVTVYGLKDKDGWALEPGKYYFLRETKAPTLNLGNGQELSFKLPDFDFQFMISEDGITHYERYIYHSNDTMSAKNYPGKDVHVKKYWGDVKPGGDAEDPDDRTYRATEDDVVVVKLQQKIGSEGAWSDNIATQGANDHWQKATELTTLTLNQDNGWEGDFKGLPMYVPAGDNFDGEDTPASYRVIEWKINGKDADINNTMQHGSNNEFFWRYNESGNTTTITNTPKNGSLKLKKAVTVNGLETSGTLADGTYDFTIQGKEGTSVASETKYVTVTIKDGKMTQAVVNGDSDNPRTPGTDGYIEIPDFKIGEYVVSEDAPDNGITLETAEGGTSVSNKEVTVTVDGKSGDAVEAAGKASFTNNVDLGGIKIKKVVTENGNATLGARAKSKVAGTYYFRVYTDQACTQIAKTVDGKDAQLTITIGTDGQAVTSEEIQNLPAGIYYVSELLNEDSTAKPAPGANPVEVEVKKGETGTAAVLATMTNDYDTGALRIKKTVTVNGVPAAKATATGSTTKADGDYTFQIFAPAYEGGTQIARVRLTFENGQVKSGKYEWIDERTQDAEGKNVLHWHESTDADSDLSIEYVEADDASYAVLRGLEPGSYEVHEHEGALPTGMSLVGGNNQGGNDQPVTVVAGQTTDIPTAAFTNNYEELGGLELTKSLITNSPIAAENVQFNFTVTVYTADPTGKTGADLEALVDKSIDGNYGQMTFHEGVATNIKLVGGEKKTASNLPTGRYFKITEGAAAGWSLTGVTVKKGDAAADDQTDAQAATGLITTTESKVEFKNKLDEGNLEVKKTVASNFNSDKSKEFKFKVVLDGYALTGTYGEKNTDGSFKDTAMKFTNGAAEFTLKDSQTKKAVGLPAGVKYTVTETTEEGFVTTWTGITSDTIVKDETKSVTATNEREYGDLRLSKTVLSAAPGDTTKFKFTVSLSDKSINGEFGSGAGGAKKLTFTNGVAQVELSGGEAALATGLPAGVTYTITEAKAEGFTQAGVTGNPGKIVANTESRVVFTNKHDDGGLVITKNVVSPSDADKDLYFPFKVELSNRLINGKVDDGNDIYYNNGVGYVFLKNGQQAVSAKLATGMTYKVTELNIGSQTVLQEVTAYLEGALATHPRPTGMTIDNVANLNNYTVTIRDGNNAITNTTGGTIQSGQILTTTSSARYTNSHITGPLTVSKKLVSDSAADRNKEFIFRVTMYKDAARTETDTSINGTFGGMEFTGGVATVKVKGNGSVTAEGLPVGQSYKVEETSLPVNFTMTGITKDGTAVSGDTADGNIVSAGSTIEFTNTRAIGPITLSKELISAREADANQDFTFTVRLGDTSVNKTYNIFKPASGTASTGTVTFTQGVATLTLKGGESVKIDGLPTEVSYQVTESGTPGFRMTGVTQYVQGGDATDITGSVAQGIITETGDAVAYQNTRIPGELNVSKKLISDLPADADQEFNFTVAFEGLNATAGNGEYDIAYANPASTGKIQLSNGSATIALKGGQSANIKGLPTDVKYTVTETGVPDFEITGVTGNGTDVKTTNNNVVGKTGTIATEPATVEVTNQRMPGKLVISKQLFSQRTADTEQNFTFTVRLGHLTDTAQPTTSFEKDDINKTYSGVTFTDGVGTVTLKGGQSKTIEGLPRGMAFTVSETSVENFTLHGVTVDQNSTLDTDKSVYGVISATERRSEFRNHREYGGLSFKKVVPEGTTAPADQIFTFTLKLNGASAVNGEGFQDTADGVNYTYGTYLENGTTSKPISFKNGSATFKVKAGQIVTVQNLPLGVTYTLTETAANGFSTEVTDYPDGGTWRTEINDRGKVTSTVYEGSVVAGDGSGGAVSFAGPTFTNTYDEGSLRVVKTVDSEYEPDTTKTYHFRVELSDKSITNHDGDTAKTGYDKLEGDTYFMQFTNGIAEFDLTDSQSASTKGLPAGTTYTVTETSYEGIVTTWTDTVTDAAATGGPKTVGTSDKGSIVKDETATTTATNKRQYGRLAVTKQVVSHTQDDKDYDYGFKVTFYTEDPSKTYDEAGRPAVASQVTGEKYKFLIQDAQGNPVKDGDVQRTAVVTDGEATFTLKDGWTAVLAEDSANNLAGLPLGIYYKVEETDNHGLSTTTKLGQVSEDSGKVRPTTTSAFTNMQIEGGLFVYKNVESHIDGDEAKSFDFMVTLYTDEACTKLASNINGTYGTDANAMTFRGGVATFSLTSGKFAYAINLPVGLYFKAVEGKVHKDGVTAAALYPDFVPSVSGDQVTPLSEDGGIIYTTGTGLNEDGTPITAVFDYAANAGGMGQIAANANRTVTVKNTRKAGNLEVIKSNEGATGSEDDEFFFTVELSDKTINGTFGVDDKAMIFNNGVATFSLKKGQSKSTVEYEGDGDDRHEIGTLPVGIRYRVTERNADGYLTSWESVTYANDTDGTNNTPTTYAYQYNQTWTTETTSEGLSFYNEHGETRTITWTDANGKKHTSTAVNGNVAGGSPDVTADSWTLGDHSTEWGWRETDAAGKATTDSTLQNAAITENDGAPNTDKVTFKNDRQKASIALYKSVYSGLASDQQKMFRFHLQLLDAVPSGDYDVSFYEQQGSGDSISYPQTPTSTGKVTFDSAGMGKLKDAEADGFDLKHGDLIVISGLPLGTRYKVTEDDDNDFESSPSSDTGRAGYALAGEKLLISDAVRNSDAVFDVVTDDDPETEDTLVPTSGPKLVDVRARSGYSNHRKMGEFEVRKTVDSDVQTDKEASYKFKIQLADETYNSTFSMAYAVAQKDGFGQDMYYSKTNPDEVLILGYKSEAEEDEDGEMGYPPIYDTVNGVKRYSYSLSDNDFVTFSKGEAFIELTDGQFAHFYASDPTGDQTWKPAQGEIALVPWDTKFGGYDPFSGLPRGVGYTVTETQSNGLTTSWAGTTTEDGNSATGAISSTTTAVADCTNTREGGNLTVSKELISEAAADKTQVFNFTVRLYTDAEHTMPLALSGKFGGMTFTNGVATVQTQGGNSVTATGLPHGTYYTVTEASATGFTLTGVTVNGTDNKKSYESTTTDDEGNQKTTTEEGSEGQILSTTPSTVIFNNTRITGPIRITKQLFSAASADQQKEFVITVRLDDTSINTAPGDDHGKVESTDKQLVFTNGIASIRLKNGEYASITNLPTGVKYSVNEENAAGYKAQQAEVDTNGNDKPNTGGISTQATTMYDIEPANAPTRIAIKENNTRELGSLTIEKHFAPESETGGDEKFTFEVLLYSTYVGEGDEANVRETGITTNPNATGEENPPEKFGDLVFNEGRAVVTLSKDNNWSATASNLPSGLYYTVKEVMTEDQKDNYRIVNSVGEIQAGQIPASGITLAEFTNERIYKGDLVVLKDVPYNIDADREQEFTLRVTLYNDYTKTTVAEDITRTYETLKTDDKPLDFVNGVATVKLRHWLRYDDDGHLISERASAKNLPEGLAYEVEEIASDELQGFEPTIAYGIYDGARKESDSTVITKDRLAEAKVTNNRKLTAAGIKKVWDDEADQSTRPESLEMKLYRSDNLNEPYKTITLPVGGKWEWTLDMLPVTDYNGNPYTYTWGEPEVEGYTLTSTATSDLEPSENAGVAGVLTTLTNTRDLGNLKVTKHFSKLDPAALTPEDLSQITFSVKNSAGTEVASNNLAEFVPDNSGTDVLTWTLTDLPTGTYTVTETNAHAKYSFETTYAVNAGETSTEPASPVVSKDATTTVDVTNTYQPHKPSFDKKIRDTNDTTDTDPTANPWQDSADYDIGDAVPYKLTATLADDVTTYKKYHVTFTDKMEDSLTYNKDAQVTVTGADGEAIDPSAYTVDKVPENDHDFSYKISWAGEGDATIADANLNGAKVEVLFTATLNDAAKLGKEGNVNACKLSYSNNPASADDSDEGELPWDYVIAFTYRLDVSKVDQNAKALEGAEFKLEKKLADGTTKEVALTTTANVFTGTGLDDGTYVLTETKAPEGCKAIDPIEFEVAAEHNAAWDYTSDADKDPAFSPDGRTAILAKLTGNAVTGTLDLAADEQLAGLAGNVVNEVQGTTAQLSVTKQVMGDDYEGDEEFNFKLEKATELRKIYGDLAPDSDVLPEETTAKAKAGETATFGEITYTEDGTYYYTISEVEPEEKTDGMVYMTEPHYVTVTVKGGVAEVKYGPSLDTSSYTAETISEAYQKLADAITDGSAYDQIKDNKLTVTNHYVAPVDGSITVRKVVVSTRTEDRTKNYGFKVTLYNDSACTKVAEDVNGTYGDMEFKNGVATFTLTASESKTAKSLPFNDDGELYYTVEETDAGGLTPKLTESKATNGKSAVAVCTNTYTAPRTSTTSTPRTTTTSTPSTTTTTRATTPRTSDDTSWIPVAALAVAGVGIVAFAIVNRRRRQQ